MYKSASRGEQFLSRTGNDSTKGSRKGFDLLGGGEKEVLTPDQQRAALVASIAALQIKIADLNKIDRTGMPMHRREQLNAEIKELGVRKYRLQCQVTDLNPLLKEQRKFEDMGDFIIKVVREQMTKPQWAGVIAEAKRRFDAQGGGNVT